MITPAQIAEAETAVTAAETELDRAEDASSLLAGKAVAAELIDARTAAHQARDEVRRLRTGYARQQERRSSRTAAEAAYAPVAEATAARLAAARRTAADAVTEARAALAQLLAATTAYDTAVTTAADDLRGRGLVAGQGGDWGGLPGGTVLLPGGDRHVPLIDGGGSLVGLLAVEAVHAVDARHPLGRQRLADLGGPGAVAGRKALLDQATAAVA